MNLNIHKVISIISYLNLPDKTLANYFVDFAGEKPLEKKNIYNLLVSSICLGNERKQKEAKI